MKPPEKILRYCVTRVLEMRNTCGRAHYTRGKVIVLTSPCASYYERVCSPQRASLLPSAAFPPATPR